MQGETLQQVETAVHSGNPAEWTCRNCLATPQQPCHNPDGSPFTEDGKPGFHFERRESASYWQAPTSGHAPTQLELFAAIQHDSDLF